MIESILILIGVGACVAIAGAVLAIAAMRAALHELNWRANWRKNATRVIHKAAAQGWNGGLPPVGDRVVAWIDTDEIAVGQLSPGGYFHVNCSGYSCTKDMICGWLPLPERQKQSEDADGE